MTSLFCFGLGYTARHAIAHFGEGVDQIAGTVREPAAAERIARQGIGGKSVHAVAFASATVPDLDAALAATDWLLVSVPPDQHGDPVLRHYAAMLARTPRLAAIVYLSTIGVYGDRGGAWLDETAEPAPVSARSRERLDAERAWTALAAVRGTPLALLRLAGIYGPGRNALAQVASGSAKRIVKPGQVFNRIHVADIGQAIAAAFARGAAGTFNIADDEPSPPADPVTFAAGLLAREPPPQVAFAQVAGAMSPMALSFYAESKRVRNEKMKRVLGVRLAYPTYREGLRALFAAGEGRDAKSA